MNEHQLKVAEEALRESEERFRGTFENAAVGIVHNDSAGRFLRVNEKFCAIVGYSRAELLQKTLQDIIHPEDLAAHVELYASCFTRGEPPAFGMERRYLRKDGSTIWVEAFASFQRDESGGPSYAIGVVHDISERKRLEEALRASERRFRVFVDHAADAYFMTDEQGRVLDANSRACEARGYTRDELLAMPPYDFVSDLNLTVVEERIRRLLAGETVTFEDRYRRKDGTVFPVEVRCKAFWEGERAFIVYLPRDVTDRKRLEEEVRLATARLELAVRGSNIGIWDIDIPDGDLRNGRLYYLNVWEQLGYERPNSPNDQETGVTLVHPDDRVAHTEAARRYLAGETGEFEVESRLCHKDGSYRWMISRGVAVRDTGGKPIRFLGTAIDITDRKQAEAALRESEGRFRQLAENVRGVFWLQEGEWQRLLYISPVYEEFWGRTCQSLYDQPRSWIDSVHAEDRDLVLAHFEQQQRGASTETDFRITRPDGSLRWMRCRAFPLTNQTGAVYRVGGLVEDITERRQFEEELRRAKEAAEAANRAKDDFLANVSHEIRTPMNAIIGMTELVLDTPLEEGQRQGLKTVKSAADNLLGIINDLLDFSKIEAGKLELVPADFSLRGAVGDTLRALAVRAHKKGLELIYQVQPDVPDALIGDAGRLRQVLLNVVGNAVKFTDEGEVVVHCRLQIADCTLKESGPSGNLQTAICNLQFFVRDTGIGIPPDHQERIFLAFEQEDTSTTRKYGGTGLGLTIASRLVALMGGTITVDSAPGRGSTFAFTARFGLQPHPPESVPAPPPVLFHGLPVLVVDDNATNRHILAEWLRGWQMNPATVGDGMAAMDALWHRAANGRPYALVLLDARMPDADGLAVAAMIRERAELAATRVILLTSGERPGDPARFRELRIDAQLLKPVQQDELLEMIYRVMSRATKVASGQWPVVSEKADPPTSSLTTDHWPLTTALHMLVAEDNELSVQVLEQVILRQGHHVRVACNGKEALALAEAGGFDLLLLDVHMPEMDGFQVVQAIRERESAVGGRLPVIALTARSRKEDRERCLAAGMDEFLTKPVRPADLWEAVDRVLGGRRQESGVRSQESANQIPDSCPLTPGLLDASVLLAACGDDPNLLAKMCQSLRERIPEDLSAIQAALRDQDAERLREAAHKCCGLLSEFSTVAGDLAGDLEDHAAGAQLEKALPILEKLEGIAGELIRQTKVLSIESLRKQAGTRNDPDRTGHS